MVHVEAECRYDGFGQFRERACARQFDVPIKPSPKGGSDDQGGGRSHGGFQAPTVLRMVPKALAPDMRAVSTTVRMSASPSAAHMAR